MTRDEAKLILGVYRCGKDAADDPFFVEALQLATQDAELAKWFAAEQAFDAQIAAGLAHDEAPAGLRAALLATLEPRLPPAVQPRIEERWNFRRVAELALAATVAVLATLAFTATPPPRGQFADFRAEMISFALPPPSLAVESSDLPQLRTWLREKGIAADIQVPAGVQQLPPAGCRTLLFRGHQVALLCFKREGGKLAHLLVIDRAAFAAAELPTKREFRQEGEWMTASWQAGDQIYVLASQGDRAQLEALL